MLAENRKYCCFVCGIIQNDFEEFKTHIINSHEIGRDYILCPLERCQAPVRDLVTHFKVKHPSEKPPQKGLLKSTMWKDFSGKKPKTKRTFQEGYHESTKMNKNFYHRSGYEKQIFELLDKWNEVIAYDVEPFKLPYTHNGEIHSYTPDVFIAFSNGKKEVWEIKPSNQTDLQKNKDKWQSATLACQARGWEFIVVTEKGINKLKKQVQEQYLNN